MTNQLRTNYQTAEIRDAHIAIDVQADAITKAGGARGIIKDLAGKDSILTGQMEMAWNTMKWPHDTVARKEMAVPVAAELLALWATQNRGPRQAEIYRAVGRDFAAIETGMAAAQASPADNVARFPKRSIAMSPTSGAQLRDV